VLRTAGENRIILASKRERQRRLRHRAGGIRGRGHGQRHAGGVGRGLL